MRPTDRVQEATELTHVEVDDDRMHTKKQMHINVIYIARYRRGQADGDPKHKTEHTTRKEGVRGSHPTDGMEQRSIDYLYKL